MVGRPHSITTPEEYDAQRGGWHEDRRLDLITELLPRDAGSLVVEFGCGSGRLLRRLADLRPDLEYLGVDIDEGLIDFARQTYARPGVRFARGDVTEHWAEAPAALLFSIDVLHHVPDTAATYRALHDALAPGGRWLVFEPNIWHPAVSWSQERMKRAGLGEDHFRPWREKPKLRAAGFDLLERRFLLAAPQSLQPTGRWDRPHRLVERFAVTGSSVAFVLRAG